MKPVFLQSEAKAELRKARRWYKQRQQGLGDSLLEEVLQSLDRIERDNSLGMLYAGGLFRFHRLKRFPYVLYYECLPDKIRVVAIAHERRRPNYWRRRKRQ